jgi:hypothetical protein
VALVWVALINLGPEDHIESAPMAPGGSTPGRPWAQRTRNSLKTSGYFPIMRGTSLLFSSHMYSIKVGVRNQSPGQEFFDSLSRGLSRLPGVSGVAMADGLLPVEHDINFGTAQEHTHPPDLTDAKRDHGATQTSSP